MNSIPVIDAESADSYCLSLTQLSVCTQIDEPLIVTLVENEVLEPEQDVNGGWLFHPQDLFRLSRAGRLMLEFDLSPVGLALVFDLLDELQRLRNQHTVAG